MLHFLLLSLWCSAALSAPQGSKRFPFPFPPLTRDVLSSYKPGKPFFTFDGIDYDELPAYMKNRDKDCFGLYIRCVQNSYFFNIVCVYNKNNGYAGNFYSYCGMEIQNCLGRPKPEGTSYNQDMYFFNGEGEGCKYNRNKKEPPLPKQ